MSGSKRMVYPYLLCIEFSSILNAYLCIFAWTNLLHFQDNLTVIMACFNYKFLTYNINSEKAK